MQHRHRQLLRRQENDISSVPAVSGVSGSTTAVTAGDLGSSLLLTPSDSNSLTASKTFSLDTATSTQTGTTSSSPPLTNSSSLSTGAVMGITVSAFLVVVVAMFAIYRHFTQRTTQARRPHAPGPPSLVRLITHVRDHSKDKQWNRKEGRGEHKDRSPSKADNPTVASDKTPDSRDLRLFQKDPSDRSVSDEKANASDNHSFDPSSMPNFVAHHLELTDNLYALPPPRPFVTRGAGSPAISWDGETVNGDPFLSLRADAVSPTTVMARQTTPRTTDSAQHHWESAEVLIMDGPTSERPSVYSETSQDPFDNSSNPRPSIGNSSNSDPRSGNNPFFNASQHNPFADRTTRSRKSSVSTARRSRSNSATSAGTVRPGGALLSLIAALDTTPIVADDLASRTSMHTTSSIYSPTEGVVPETPKAL